MIYIPINALPTGFKPYPVKSFRMKALTIDQAMKLGSTPTDRNIRDMMAELTDEINRTMLVSKAIHF